MGRASVIEIEDARIFFKNFSGREGKYNPAGKRNFCVEIDPAMVEQMQEDGWNIKWSKPRSEEYEPAPYIKVNIRFDKRPPEVLMVTSRTSTPLNEETIGILDDAEITKVDLVVSPYTYDGGVTGYVKAMYVTIKENRFRDRYVRDQQEEEIF